MLYTEGGAFQNIHYISGGDGLCAIVVREGTNGDFNYFFPYTDHLGSILTLTMDEGSVAVEQNFDAWGRKRNVDTWDYANVGTVPAWLYRGFTGHEHLPEFGLINMNARLYDPVLGRMLSADNYVSEGTQGLNRYSYANNNPLKFTDPSGNFVVETAIACAIFGGVLNASIQAFSGNINSTEDGLKAFGLGALNGFLVGTGAGTLTAGLINTGLGAASSFLPSINLGDETFQLSISPALVFGTSGFGVGVNIGASVNTGLGSFGISYGVTGYAKHNITNQSFFEQRLGYGATFGGSDFNLSIGSSTFWGGGIGQTTGSLGIGGKDWSVSYENDYQFGLTSADGGDRFRTTGLRLQYKDVSFGFNLFTGDPGLENSKRKVVGEDKSTGFRGTYVENTTPHRLGALYVGYKGYRTGVNSELVRDFFQNKKAHGNGYVYPLFQVMDRKISPYLGYQTLNPFTTW